MPPNERLRPSANHLDLSFIGKAALRRNRPAPQPAWRHARQRASAFIPTIRRQFHGRRVTMAVVNRLR